MTITGRTKTGDIQVDAPPEPARAGELADDKIWPARFEALQRDVRELIRTLREQVIPAIDRFRDGLAMAEQDRNELFLRVTELEAKAAKAG